MLKIKNYLLSQYSVAPFNFKRLPLLTFDT
jgi:hypothetical protein